jgi:bifunctional N-acetylglucosamine-1-phosphate-uridyltransferase/glucosamine-1-phosphate-acetyltransferase GlmU-like protein
LKISKDLTRILNPFKKFSKENFLVHDFINYCKSYLDSQEIKSKKYQAVIMAAGKGSRMNITYPKCLHEFNYPTGRSSIIANTILLIEKLDRNIEKIYIIINTNDYRVFKDKIKHDNVKFITLDNENIKGTAHCLNYASSYFTPNIDILLFWGDLALMPLSNLSISIKMHEKIDSSITLPTRYKSNPYVAFLRNNSGMIQNIVHSNETKRLLGWAEQDCLFFILKFSLLDLIQDFISIYSKNSPDKKNDIDFVHYIKFISSKHLRVLPLPIASDSQVKGMNTPKSAIDIQEILNKYDVKKYNQLFLNHNITI